MGRINNSSNVDKTSTSEQKKDTSADHIKSVETTSVEPKSNDGLLDKDPFKDKVFSHLDNKSHPKLLETATKLQGAPVEDKEQAKEIIFSKAKEQQPKNATNNQLLDLVDSLFE